MAVKSPAWEARRTHGFWSALWLTWRDSVFRPVRFFRQLPPRGGYGPALSYAVIFTALGLLFSLYWGMVESVLAGEGVEASGLLGSLVAAVIGLAFLVPLYLGFLFVAVAVLHVGFLAVGAGRRGYEATFRAVAYASGPSAFALFPFFGPFVSGVWGMVLLFVAVREVQRTTNGRATLGFLMPLIAFVFLLALLGVVLELLLRTTALPPAL